MRFERGRLIRLILVGGAVLAGSSTSRAGLLGPSPYLSFNDSPFKGGSYSYFHLEDFEDGLLNTPGASVDHGTVAPRGTIAVDSVDGDDGVIDGSGSGGASIYDFDSMTFSFDAGVLGALPTHAGIVFTDGDPGALFTFEAFDQNGVSLGSLSANLGDDSFYGTTAEDRFFGAINLGGISRILITDNGSRNALEVDHLQYGLAGSVPEPSALLSAALGLAGLAGAAGWRRGRSRVMKSVGN